MELFWRIVSWLARASVLGLVFRFTAKKLSEQGLITQDGLLASFLGMPGAMVVMLMYSVFFFPYLLDPFLKLPTVTIVDIRELLPVTDAPRGEKLLSWVKAFPGTDLINIRIFPGNSALMAVSPQAHRDVLHNKDEGFGKPEAGRVVLEPVLGNGLILSRGEIHHRHRRLLNHSFRIQNIRSLHPLIATKTRLFLDEMMAEMVRQRSVEMGSWGSRLTMDIIGPALMSKDFQALTKHESELEVAFSEIIAPSTGQALLFMTSLWIPGWVVKRLPTAANKMLHRNAQFIRATCGKILDEKETDEKGKLYDEEEPSPDILGRILATRQFSRSDTIDQMMTFLAAGHETTASSIAWAAHLLTLPSNYHYQQRLRDEVRSAILAHQKQQRLEGRVGDDQGLRSAFSDTTDGILPFITLESLPLLNGVCREVLRLYPPVTNTARKAMKNTIVAGVPVPKSTLVVVAPWAINRNPEFWGPDADKMVPERWIDTLPDGSKRPNKSGGAPSNLCEITFLHGQRACIGRGLAEAELRYALAALVAQYEMRRLPGDDGSGAVPAGALTIKPKGGLHVSIQPWEEKK